MNAAGVRQRAQDLRLALAELFQALRERLGGDERPRQLEEDLGVALLGVRRAPRRNRPAPASPAAANPRASRPSRSCERASMNAATSSASSSRSGSRPRTSASSAARVLVGRIGARRPPAPRHQRRHLHDVAGLLVRQPRQLRDRGAPVRVAPHQRQRVLGRLPLAVQVIRQQRAQIGRAGREPAGMRARTKNRQRRILAIDFGAGAYQSIASSAAMAAPSV